MQQKFRTGMESTEQHTMDSLNAECGEAYHPLTLKELAAMPFPEPTWVVKDLLPQGALTLFSGREKSGKSLLMADMAACVSQGAPFLQHASTPGTVILVPAEENLRDIQDRLNRRLQDDTDVPLLVLPVNDLEQGRLDLANPACISKIRAMVSTYQPSLLILDPLRELHDLAENEADAMGPLLRPLRKMAHELNVAVMLTHHMSKSGSSRGSTAILAACDQGWEFHLHEVSEADGSDLSGSLGVKGRYGPRQRLGIRLGDGLRWEASLQALPPSSSTLTQVTDYLRLVDEPLDASKIATNLGRDLKTVQNALSEAMGQSEPLISRVGTGKRNDPYRYLVEDDEDDACAS
jgi:hypothetical protein